jgi:hypothetical protein
MNSVSLHVIMTLEKKFFIYAFNLRVLLQHNKKCIMIAIFLFCPQQISVQNGTSPTSESGITLVAHFNMADRISFTPWPAFDSSHIMQRTVAKDVGKHC